jgi:hypothetical protein
VVFALFVFVFLARSWISSCPCSFSAHIPDTELLRLYDRLLLATNQKDVRLAPIETKLNSNFLANVFLVLSFLFYLPISTAIHRFYLHRNLYLVAQNDLQRSGVRCG